MHEFLASGFYYLPAVRLPFEVMRYWIQLEIHFRNFEFASEFLIKPYINKSTKFNSLEDEQEQTEDPLSSVSDPRPWIKGNASKVFKLSKGRN